MKKSAFIIGTISIIVLALGILFKMHHWQGADMVLIFGMLFSVISFPLIAIYQSKRNFKYKNTYIYWAISTSIMIIGIFFKLNHYNSSIIIHAIGTGLFILFSILFAFKIFKSEY